MSSPSPVAPAQPPIRLLRLDPGFAGLGLVLDFLARSEAFHDFKLKQITKTVRYQLDRGFHICALQGDRVVGYCGWLEIAEPQGQLWLAGLATLRPLPQGSLADAAALTLVASSDKTALRKLIRKARELNPGKQIFFKRDYGGKTRKSTVKNLGAAR